MNRIKELRTMQNLTQADLAKKIGVNQSAVGKYEREELEPNITLLKKISTIFECSIDYLLGRSDDFGVIHIPAQKNTVDELSTDEKKLLETYRALNTKNKMHVSVYADVRLEEQEEQLKNRG